MKISVITVCFNAQNEIEQTINSVLSQTYKNLEFIIIDGASSDATLDIIKKYRDNIDVLVSEKDDGIFYAMNKGISCAKGDLLVFINAGDSFYSDNSLEQSVHYIKKKPKARIFFGDINVIEENGVQWIKTFRDTDKLTLISNCLCHQSVFTRRNLFEKIGGFDENYPVISEHDFNLRAIIQHKARAQYIPVIVSNFSMGGDSTARHRIKNTSWIIQNMAVKNYGKFNYKLFRLIVLTLRSIPCRKTAKKIRKAITRLFGLAL